MTEVLASQRMAWIIIASALPISNCAWCHVPSSGSLPSIISSMLMEGGRFVPLSGAEEAGMGMAAGVGSDSGVGVFVARVSPWPCPLPLGGVGAGVAVCWMEQLMIAGMVTMRMAQVISVVFAFRSAAVPVALLAAS